MTLEKAKEASRLNKVLLEAEDQIAFLKQFIPTKPEDRVFFFNKAKPPRLGICIHHPYPDDCYEVYVDDETIGFMIKSFEVKRDRILREIDAI